MPYHVCHKCGLPRKVTEPDKADLGQCECLGQTWFDDEEKPRTRDESIVIGVNHFLEFMVLYFNQKRDAYDFERLARKYAKVLSYKAVYKVDIHP